MRIHWIGGYLSMAVALIMPGLAAAELAAPSWRTVFVRPAFWVQKPTALHEPESWALVQTVKPGILPLALADTLWIEDGAGARYGRMRTGELILLQSPPGDNSEHKGQVVFLPRGGRRVGRLRQQSGLAPVPFAKGEGEELPAGTPIQTLYAVADEGGLAWVFAEADVGEGWLAWKDIDWAEAKDGKQEQAAAGQFGQGRSEAGVIRDVLAYYNQQVERAVEYYKTAGQPVAARTFRLVEARGRSDRIEIDLARRSGVVALSEAEALLERLLVRELGREISVKWP
ncbi:MAG: hypothetical protein GKR89_15850 [Candidatus Latescibacteria bacterium]|nr:hypothetical protein [Candidatus Latescibacterota bacterium]